MGVEATQAVITGTTPGSGSLTEHLSVADRIMLETIRILIAEDEPVVALDLGETVISLGYQLAGFATTAADAVYRAGDQRPDLVLMDIRLGTSDGVYAARHIKERFGLPVVFVSAFAGDLDQRGVADLGLVVPKPFTTEMLRRAIEDTVAATSRPLA